MKFHRIAIENVNSLYGTQEIDFDEDLDGVPLYLIMGPTGSGKTTILDAVCLALFGTTPRQEDADGGVSGVGARVNSYGTGQSRAEVDFSILEQDGEARERNRYRAVWDFWRAHEDADGRPQDPRRELKKKNGNGEWEAVVSSRKKKEYEPAFDAVLDGMELSDFLRSIMLAQGEFDELLKAGHDEKAAILERLTDTSEYKELGRRAHRRFQKERDALEDIEQRIDEFDGASKADIAAEETRLAEQRGLLEELKDWQATAANYLEWLEDSRELDAEFEEAGEALEAARKEREKHAHKFERLEADAKTKPAREPLRDVDRLAPEVEELEEETIPECQKVVEAVETRLEDAETALEAREEAFEKSQTALEERKPEIEAGKKQKTLLDKAIDDRKSLADKVEGLSRHEKEQKQAVEAARQARETAEQTLASKKTALQEAPDAEQLQNQLAGLKAERDRHDDQWARVERLEEEIDGLTAKIEKKQEQLKGQAEALEAKRDEVAPLEESLQEAESRLEALLGEAETPRARRDELQAERSEAEGAKLAVEKLRSALEERGELKEARSQKKEALEEARAALDAAEQHVGELEARENTIEEQLQQLALKLQSVDLRRQLEAGQKCPVCGSKEHPDLHDEQQGGQQLELGGGERKLEEERRELEADGEALAERLKEARNDQQSHSARVERLTVKLEQLEEQIQDRVEAIEAYRKSLREETGDWYDVAPELSDAAATKRAIRACEARLESLGEARDELDAAEEARDAADHRLEEAREKLETLEEARRKTADAVEALEEKKREKTETLDEEEDALEELRRALRAKFQVDLGVPVPTSQGSEDAPDFDRALEEARERINAWKDARDEFEAAKEDCEEAREAEKDAKKELKTTREALEERKDELEEVQDTVRELKENLAEKFGDEDPVEVEKKLQKKVEDARDKRETAQKEVNEAEKALSEAENDLENAEERLKEKREALGEARDALEAALEDIDGMASVEEVREAMLAEEEREQLRETCEALDQAVHDAETRLEDLQAKRDAHDKAQPDGLARDAHAPDVHAIEPLRAAKSQLGEAIAEVNQRIGGLRESLQQMRASLEKHRELVAERKEQEKRFELWRTMNHLIGERNGDKFKQFAQALNLDRIVDQANNRLEDLHPRYQLRTKRDPETNLPTLDFEVVDRHHAGQARPLSTLSGGETFLVSLALALALADQQTLEMPIETLFLDEGFGTLDRDSLHKAVDILKNLRAGGQRTVGVISHVEGLREKIPARIVVKRQQEGRSTIEIPEE